MKKIIIILTLMFSTVLSSNAIELSDYWQVRLTLRDYNKALSGKNIEKVKSFYAEDYKSSDGFTLDELLQMLEKTYNTYSKMTQRTKINSINTFDNYAIVQLTDITNAVVHPDKIKSKEKDGKLKGKSVYTLYFKKTDDKWKIFYDEIVAETTSLKYGVAKKIPMELIAPALIKKNQQYDLSLKMEKPSNIFALASITNEQIEYPTPKYDEKFRKIPSEGELERIVRANDKSKNEYAIASIGFTKVSVNEEEAKARIEIIGMAYLMKRINMAKIKEENEK